MWSCMWSCDHIHDLNIIDMQRLKRKRIHWGLVERLKKQQNHRDEHLLAPTGCPLRSPSQKEETLVLILSLTQTRARVWNGSDTMFCFSQIKYPNKADTAVWTLLSDRNLPNEFKMRLPRTATIWVWPQWGESSWLSGSQLGCTLNQWWQTLLPRTSPGPTGWVGGSQGRGTRGSPLPSDSLRQASVHSYQNSLVGSCILFHLKKRV